MKSEKFLEKHLDLIRTALEDYQQWFDKGEENYKSIGKCLNDLDKVE